MTRGRGSSGAEVSVNQQVSRVPNGSKQDNLPHNDDVNDVSVLLESELIGPV